MHSRSVPSSTFRNNLAPVAAVDAAERSEAGLGMNNLLECFPHFESAGGTYGGPSNRRACFESWPQGVEDKGAWDRFRHEYQSLPQTLEQVKCDPRKWANPAPGFVSISFQRPYQKIR